MYIYGAPCGLLLRFLSSYPDANPAIVGNEKEGEPDSSSDHTATELGPEMKHSHDLQRRSSRRSTSVDKLAWKNGSKQFEGS
jgi:hypothetical protein